VHNAAHGIMQIQIQRMGKTINAFKTLEDLKVFFDNQYNCDVLEKRILKRGGEHEHDKDHDKKEKKGKKAKKSKKNNDDDADKHGKDD
jgi:hypothetical protein